MGRKKHRRRNRDEPKASANSLPAVKMPVWNSGVTIALLIVVGLSLALNFTGINYGQPGGHSWHPDSIAGSKTIYHMPNLFKQWKHKYPRVHFMINAAFYKPFLNHWQKNPVTVQVDGGRQAGKGTTALPMQRQLSQQL